MDECNEVYEAVDSREVVVFECVSSEIDIMLALVFKQGFKLNSDGSVKLVETVIKHWLKGIVSLRRTEGRS